MVSKIKTELLIFLVCLLAGLGLVLYSVLAYNQGMREFTAQLHIVLLGALAIYFLVLLFRLVFWIFYKLIH